MCTVAVQVFVACLRALCSADGAPSEDTCNTLQTADKTCWDKYGSNGINVILLMANCSPETKPALLTTATPPRTTTPSADWYYMNYRYGKGMEYIGRYADLHCVIADLSLFSPLQHMLHGEQNNKICSRPLGVVHRWLSLRKMTRYSPGHKVVSGAIEMLHIMQQTKRS